MSTIGFTGTRVGMTHLQKVTVRTILNTIPPNGVVHGDCVGADAEFHDIIESLNETRAVSIHITLRPSTLHDTRAHCLADYEYYAEKPLIRNKYIVSDSDILIAAPKEFHEIQRSGTWATIRHARKCDKKIFIVYPDGTVDHVVEPNSNKESP